jgi:hypothetical protein
MKSVKFLVVALLSMVAFVSCNKEKEAELTLQRTSLYFVSWQDAPQEISYVATNAESVAVSSHSVGWNATVNAVESKIVIWQVGANEDGLV